MKSDSTANYVDIREVLGIIWRRKWLILIPLVLVASLTAVGSLLITPEYESSTIVQIDPYIPLIGELQRFIGQGNAYRRRSNEEQLSKLKGIYNEVTSRRYAALLADRMQLDEQPHIVEKAIKIRGLQPELSENHARLTVLQYELKEQIKVNWASGDQISIQISSPDPEQARDIANTLAEVFIEEKVKQDLLQVRTSQDFSDVQLDRYERQLTSKINEKTRLEKEYLEIQQGISEIGDSNRVEISTEIDRINSEIEDLRNDERSLLAGLGAIEELKSGKITLKASDTKKQLWRALEDRIPQVSDLMTRYSWRDPQIISYKVRQRNTIRAIESENALLVDQQYASLDASTRALLTRRFNTKTNLDYLYAKKPYLQQAHDKLSPQSSLGPEYEARLDQIEREIMAATDIRDRFKRQQESSTISQALIQDLSSSKYRVVEPAQLPLSPSKPDRRKIIMMGILMGLVLGGGAALLVELLDRSIKKPEDIESLTGLPVLGVVPKMGFLKKLNFG